MSAASNLGLTCDQPADSVAVDTHRYVESQAGKGLHTITPEMMGAVRHAGWPSKPFTIRTFGQPLPYYAFTGRGDEATQGGAA